MTIFDHDDTTTAPRAAIEPLFKSTEHALRYAFTYSTQQYGKSAMAVMYSPPGSGRGLGGIDGAGQAGMVRAEVDKLSPAQQAVLIGRYAPPDLPCACGAACCSKHRPNKEWAAMLDWLARYTAVLFSGCLSNERLRRALVRNVLTGQQSEYTALGKQYGVDRNTVAKHAAMIEAALIGTRGEKGEFDRAYERVDDLLHDAGLIGQVGDA
ncbi:DNA-binding protein [Burkholderia sp. Ac-20345]|uniref:DNA-binding protein n=1 Tax=Burkholderia sp. Ac-20345 TaxID=2703891 RepID=UPI00197BA456|nr:DNA-binding protein [Burkholderia sp. Ac-20345]MBN3777423.1 DNA-binding protein [Burkholderia sp. Ac-20345]